MYIHVYECKYMHVYGTASNPQLEYCFDSTQAVKIIVLALQYHDTSPRYSASCTAFNSFQHHYLQPNMVCTSTYKYIQCTDTVRTGMYFVHNHTSHPIRPDQPCDAGESQLRAGSAHAEQHPSCQQSPRRTMNIHMTYINTSVTYNVYTCYIQCLYKYIQSTSVLHR